MRKLYSVLGNSQKLDGGSMFGNAPKAMWQRWAPADEHNRIDLACRCLLVRDGDRTVLFEAGIGAFFPPPLRERFGVVHEPECWGCHKKMNPLGMPFEQFNHVGRFRAHERGKPVVTSGGVDYTNDDDLDGDVANVRELMEKLGRSDLVRQSFLRHVFRYWMGRNEVPRDSRTLRAMDRAYVDSGGSFREVLVTLLTSDSFLYRK